MAYFITKAEVLDAAFARDLKEDRIPDNLIEACGIRYLVPVLGEDFYDAVVAAPSSYSDLEPYLIAYVAYFVKFDVLSDIFTETGDSGVYMFIGNNKRTISLTDLENLKQGTLNIAHRMGERLLKYLEDNTDTYTLYVSTDNAMNQVQIAGGVVFDAPKITGLDEDDTEEIRYY